VTSACTRLGSEAASRPHPSPRGRRPSIPPAAAGPRQGLTARPRASRSRSAARSWQTGASPGSASRRYSSDALLIGQGRYTALAPRAMHHPSRVIHGPAPLQSSTPRTTRRRAGPALAGRGRNGSSPPHHMLGSPAPEGCANPPASTPAPKKLRWPSPPETCRCGRCRASANKLYHKRLLTLTADRLQVLQATLAADAAGLVGPEGRRILDSDRGARWQRVGPGDLGRSPGAGTPPTGAVRRGHRELPVPSYQLVAATDLLDQFALERMLAKLSTRRYQTGLEPVS